MTMTIDLETPIERASEHFGEKGRTTTYSVGKTCISIERDPTGGVWIQVDTHHRYWVPDKRIACIHEQRETSAKVPDEPAKLPLYAVPLDDGSFKCASCRRDFATLQAVKVHYGRSHQ